MSEEQKIKGYHVKAPKTQRRLIRCDEMELVQVPTYVFRRKGKEVERVLASDLETQPTVALAPTAEDIQAQGQAIQELTRGNFGHHPNLG